MPSSFDQLSSSFGLATASSLTNVPNQSDYLPSQSDYLHSRFLDNQND